MNRKTRFQSILFPASSPSVVTDLSRSSETQLAANPSTSRATEQISFLDMFEADVQNSGTGALSRGYRSYAERERREKLEAAVDAIRRRHGENAIIRGNTGNPEIGVEGAWKKKVKGRKEEKEAQPQTAWEQPPVDESEPASQRSRSEYSKAEEP